MKFTVSAQKNFKSQIVFVFDDKLINEKALQKDLADRAKKIISSSNFGCGCEEFLPIISENSALLIVGVGSKKEFTKESLVKTITATHCELKKLKITEVSISIGSIIENISEEDAVKIISQTLINAQYCYDELKTKKNLFVLDHVEFLASKNEKIDTAIKIGSAIAKGQSYAKDLKNSPANICTTQFMFDEAKKIASKPKFNFNYVDEAMMLELGMECIHAVGRGSDHPTYIACMEYNGGKKDEKPIVLVGKGLAFDTGGLCLKPGAGMPSMKMDMGGAASVFGTMQALAELDLPINVVGVVALVENSLDARSYRPGDVLTSMAGITVEVGNTDAEGRLALCDTLTYIKRYNPKVVVDMATLTGAIIGALGGDITGLFANDDDLSQDLLSAGNESLDIAWRLPLHKPYHKLLKSDVADMNNIGGPQAGSITAGLFLSRFTEEYRWAHLDIAGTAMGDFAKCVASGRPVPLLVQYLLNQA